MAKEATATDHASFIGSVMTSPENAALNAQLAGMNALSFNALGKDDALVGKDYYRPTNRGAEARIGERLAKLRAIVRRGRA